MPSTASAGHPGPSVGLGIDVGGTGIKVGVVDLAEGRVMGESRIYPTPVPATPDAVAEVIVASVSAFDWEGPVGIALPSVIHEGKTRIAHNIDASWVGCQVGDLFSRHLPDHRVHMLNDADAAGLTEVHYGAAEGVEGVVVVLTLGTGIGSALLLDGRLLPNSEFGHLMVQDTGTGAFDEAEHLAAGSVRTRDDLSFEDWAPRVSTVLRAIEDLLWPRLFVLGGGISDAADSWFPLLENRTPVVAASRLNDAGIIGAALYAAAREGVVDLSGVLSDSAG